MRPPYPIALPAESLVETLVAAALTAIVLLGANAAVITLHSEANVAPSVQVETCLQRAVNNVRSHGDLQVDKYQLDRYSSKCRITAVTLDTSLVHGLRVIQVHAVLGDGIASTSTQVLIPVDAHE